MKYLTIVLLFLSTNCFGITKINQSTTDSIITLLNQKIETYQTQEIKLEKTNDNLKNQLVIYMAKEDYFSAALGDQSNRFVLIVSILVASLALFSFSWYYQEKKRINKKFKKFEDQFNFIKNETKSIEKRLLYTAGNSYGSIALNALKEENITVAFEFYVYAAKNFFSGELLAEEPDYKVTIRNLNNAKKALFKITNDELHKEIIRSKKKDVQKNLEIFQGSENNEITELVAEIRVGIKNYLSPAKDLPT